MTNDKRSKGNTRADHATAHHEAGHAVAHIRLGIEQLSATIAPKAVPGGRRLGAVIAEGVQQVWNKEQAAPMVIAFGAGYAALVAAGHGDHEARDGADDDFDQAQYLIDFWGLPDTLDASLAQAVELMRRPENVAAVALVAEHLLKHKMLDADYLAVLVDLADGNTTEAEFARYLQLRSFAARDSPAR